VTFPKAFLAILWGGLAVGILDISQAMIASYAFRGTKPTTVLQSVAGGLLGRQAALNGGAKTAFLGAVLHFFIAFCVAAVYYLASRKLTFLTQHFILWGLIYGEMVFIFMNFVVLPLSAIHRVPPFTPALIITGPIGHLFLVGLPIALAVRRYST